MSDFLVELRSDLLDAHERYGRRSLGGRLARPVHPRTWRPATILAVAAAAACVVAAVVGIRALQGPAPGSIHAIAEVRVGGQPNAAAAGFGYLWVADFDGNIIQVDPTRHRVVRRIPIGMNADTIAAGAGAVWVTTHSDSARSGRLLRIDPRTHAVTASVAFGASTAAVHAGAAVVWLEITHEFGRALERVDPTTARTIVTIRTPDANEAAAIAGDSLWTLAPTGLLEHRDLETGQVLRRLPGLGSALDAPGDTPLAADASGLWVLRPGMIVHVVGARVVRRMPLSVPTFPTLAADGSALWVATGRQYPLRYGIARVDRGTGKPTGTLDLGSHQPKALVPSAQGLWVVAADGTALLVR